MKHNMRNYIFVLPLLGGVLSLMLILIPHTLTNAHGAEESFEIVEESYLIDIGFDTPTIEAQTPVRFDFGLFNNESKLPVDFDNIWVRIEEAGAQGRTIFASDIGQPSFGPTTMLFSFSNEGAYSMHARFQNAEDEKIVEVTVPVPVQKSSSGSSFLIGWTLFLALFAGLSIGIFIPSPFREK